MAQHAAAIVYHRSILRHTTALLFLCFTASAEHRMIKVGGRSLSINCEGNGSPAIILLAGGGRTAKDWSKVQPAVSAFTRVCSYDRAGLGESEDTSKPQSSAEVIDDLHNLLNSAGEKPPYVLVGHSLAGIYARRFATKFPREVVGLVMVDSSHEEQAWRLHEIDPQRPPLRADLADLFFDHPGQRLEWHTQLPLMVLARGKLGPRPPDMSEKTFVAFGAVWRDLQQDLATRSPKGHFQIAEQSGHYIHTDQPELVIEAIRRLTTSP